MDLLPINVVFDLISNYVYPTEVVDFQAFPLDFYSVLESCIYIAEKSGLECNLAILTDVIQRMVDYGFSIQQVM